MATVAKIEEKIGLLKKEIKQWEHSFANGNDGRLPEFKDVKSNEGMARKYKKYEKYKRALRSTLESEAVKVVEVDQSQLNDNEFDDIKTKLQQEEEEETLVITELGPTPQLGGRILGLFDLKLLEKEPQIPETPTKKQDATFKTPTKKAKLLTFGDMTPSTARVLQEPNGSPSKEVMDTPIYLRRESRQVEPIHFGSSPTLAPTSDPTQLTPTKWAKAQLISPTKIIEPSPVLKSRNKSIFQMGHEIEELKRQRENMHESDIEDEDIRLLIQSENLALSQEKINETRGNDEDTTKDEADQTTAEPEPVYRKKARTQKRSTRRVRIKTMPMDMEDDLATVDIHKKLGKIEQDANPDTDESEEVSSEEDESEYEEAKKTKWAKLDAQKRNAFVSNNFVRLKINKKNRGKFFKRR
ncbi:unnamed protein product [Kuraishia capsulata CBS 1993]|uniref:DNA replication regulator SLD2 n=1 Tax=Kuraishia capsulata CBS 1993 TaxID=1382522 RepID=W6MS24_9ASCO|nr:uncharacterized protein KUCA_T00005579001 [Kuraishia capsulata CBS 1993]CDK29586.1 unnamed protein product [Kuraishia capsulata CBS 1993]